MARLNIINYVKQDSFVHRLKGSTKLICFLLWSTAAMITYDTRFLLFLCLFALFMFKVSKIKFQDVKVVVYFILFFLALNLIMIYLFSPEEGVRIYGSRTVLWEGIGRYTVTVEQLFYQFNILIKYLAVFPVALLFVVTTYPSEFASSLNQIGVPYRIAYAVSIALRYIPTIQDDFIMISKAQQARGNDMSKKQPLFTRLKHASYTLFPLIFSSLNKIDVISNAMILRGFGKKSKRTWYQTTPITTNDLLSIAICMSFLVVSIILIIMNQGRFYSPFN